MNTIKRSIRFYRFYAGLDDAGKPLPFDMLPILKKIDKTALTDKYLQEDDRRILCFVEEDLSKPYRARLGSIRTTDLPLVEQRGKLSALDIPPSAGLFDAIHLVFFEDNVVGFDFNNFGPRINKFLDYLQEVTPRLCPNLLALEPLVNPKIIDQLQHIRQIKLFDLKVHSSYLAQISRIDDSLGAALYAAQTLGNPEIIEVKLQVGGRSTNNLNKSLLGIVKKLIRRSDSDQELSKLMIRGFDDALQQNIELDLLSDKIVAKENIVRIEARSRELDSASAYQAIIRAYTDRKELIQLAASMQL